MSISKTNQSGDWDFVENSQTDFVPTKSIKGARIDQSGTIIFTPQGMEAKPAGNYLAGELLQIQGVVTITTDATSRVQIFY